MGATIDACRFVQFVGNVLEEGAQHPDREGLVDRDQDRDDRQRLAIERGRVLAQDRPQDFSRVDEDRQIARHQHRMRQGAKDQRDDQDPEGQVRTGPRKAIAGQCADRQRDGHDAGGHDQRVLEVAPEPVFDPDGIIVLGRQPENRRAKRTRHRVKPAQKHRQNTEKDDQERDRIGGRANQPPDDCHSRR